MPPSASSARRIIFADQRRGRPSLLLPPAPAGGCSSIATAKYDAELVGNLVVDMRISGIIPGSQEVLHRCHHAISRFFEVSTFVNAA